MRAVSWWYLTPMLVCVLAAVWSGVAVEYAKVRPFPRGMHAIARGSLLLAALAMIGVGGLLASLPVVREMAKAPPGAKSDRSREKTKRPEKTSDPRRDPKIGEEIKTPDRLAKTESKTEEPPPRWQPAPPTPRPTPPAASSVPSYVRSEAVNTSLYQWTRSQDVFQVVCFGQQGQQFTYPIWSEDGQRLYVVESSRWLIEIRVQDWMLLRRVRLWISSRPTAVSRCQAGLLVSRRSSNNGLTVLLIDPQAMCGKRQFEMPGVANIAASPTSSSWYALKQPDDACLVLDASSNSPTPNAQSAVLMSPAERGDSTGSRSIAVTPDGRFLLYLNGSGLHRYRIEGERLRHEESVERLSLGGADLDVSLDSKYAVCRGDRSILNRTAALPDAWCILDVAKLAKPMGTIWYDGLCPPVTLDPVTGNTYVFGTKGLGVIGRDGQVKHTLSPAAVGQGPNYGSNPPLIPVRLVAHPKGNAVLVLGNDRGCFIQMPTEKESQ